MEGQYPARWRVALALGTVYLVWGSTYLAIWLAVADMPPFAMGALRFGAAAALLAAVAVLARHPWPRRAELVGPAFLGIALLGVGNGGVVYAAGRLPSGLTALLVASLPLWLLAFEAGAARRLPTARQAAAVLVGLSGVAALLAPGLSAGGAALGPGGLPAAGIVLAATAIWAAGQLAGRGLAAPASGVWNAAGSLASAALFFAVAALALGEWPRLDLAAVGGRTWLAFAYLVVVGSCVTWSAFAWLVRHVRSDLVGTYAYVNPLVAVLLGVWWLAEPFTPAIATGGALIVGAVALAIGAKPAPRGAAPSDA